MNMKKTALVALLCLVLCVSLLPVSAFADQTVVIIGGSVEKENAVVTQGAPQNTYVSGGSNSSVIVADNTSGNVIVGKSADAESSSVIVMPNGSVVTSKPAQTVQVTAQAEQVAQTATASSSELVNELLKRINNERLANGLGILGYDSALQATADLRAKESAQQFGHTRPDGTAAVTAVTVDYNVAGENLIQVTTAYATAGLMVETWMASETHRANILLADFTQTAFGVYEQNGVTYVSEIFTD